MQGVYVCVCVCVCPSSSDSIPNYKFKGGRNRRNQINVESWPCFKDGLVHFLIAESRVTAISAHNQRHFHSPTGSSAI